MQGQGCGKLDQILLDIYEAVDLQAIKASSEPFQDPLRDGNNPLLTEKADVVDVETANLQTI